MLLNAMASRTYNLRARTGTGVTTQSGRVQNDSPSPIDNDNREREVVPLYEDMSPSNEATYVARSYSDVVASRPPSRSRERPVVPSGGLVTGPENSDAPIRSSNEVIAYSGESEGHGSNEEVETPNKLEWTTVQRRRARSLGSFRDNENRPLTSEQKKVVNMAENGLTTEQREKFQLRQKKVQRRDDSLSSRGEGPSEPKKKAIDPREWGNVDFGRENLDIEAQAAALESYKKQLKDKRRSKEKAHRKRRSRSTNRDHARRDKDGKRSARRSSRHGERPAESQPAAQIAPKSYLGTALKILK